MSKVRTKIAFFRRLDAPVFFLYFSYFIVFLGHNIWRVTLPGFAVESFNVTSVQIGFIFSIAALPGLFSVVISFIGQKKTLLFLLALAFSLIGLGLLATGAATNWYFLLLGALLLNSGIAIYYPAANTEYLRKLHREKSLSGLSVLKSFGPLGAIVAAGLLFYVFTEPYNYVLLLSCSGILVFIVGLISIQGMEQSLAAFQLNVVHFKKKLWPFYALNFLNGCRSGIFRTFVPFSLISQYGFGVKNTVFMMLIGSLMTFVGYHIVAFLGHYIKPSRLLRLLYLVIGLNFLGFWLIKSPQLLALLYLIDSLLFCTSAITDSHLKYVSKKGKDILGDLAGGVSLYSLGGVIMPAIGGFIYQYFDVKIFLVGSFFAISSFIISKFLRFADM